MRPERRITTLACLTASLMAGCFPYTEVRVAPLGQHARVTLPVADRGDEGEDEPMVVAGTVISNELGITIQETTVREFGEFRSVTLYDTLFVPEADVRRVEVKRLSWGRTLIFGGALGFLMKSAYSTFRPGGNR